MGYQVKVYIYDLSNGMARQLSPMFLGTTIEGIWHTGIVVFGKEYYYGGGIQACAPGTSTAGTPQQIVDIGETDLTEDVFRDFLQEISHRFTPETYSLLRHNCNNFSDECARFLCGTGIPSWITGLPERVLNTPMGAMLRPMIEQFEHRMRQGTGPAFVPGFEQGNAAAAPGGGVSSAPVSASTSISSESAESRQAAAQEDVPIVKKPNKAAAFLRLVRVANLRQQVKLSPQEFSALSSALSNERTYGQVDLGALGRVLTAWSSDGKAVLALYALLVDLAASAAVRQKCHTDVDFMTTLSECLRTMWLHGAVVADAAFAPARTMSLAAVANLCAHADTSSEWMKTLLDVCNVALRMGPGESQKLAARVVFNTAVCNRGDDVHGQLTDLLVQRLVDDDDAPLLCAQAARRLLLCLLACVRASPDTAVIASGCLPPVEEIGELLARVEGDDATHEDIKQCVERIHAAAQ
ncbi:MAG: hypothetical protein MHM6MM_001551 [Cercozoa sp. M6MM]